MTPRISDDEFDGIISLINQRRIAEKAVGGSKRSAPDNENSTRSMEIQRRGAVMVLKSICSHFGPDLPLKVSYLWDVVMNTMESAKSDYPHQMDVADR